MKESDKWGIKAMGCIILFAVSAMLGVLFAINDNAIGTYVCCGGLVFAFGYGFLSIGKQGSSFENEKHASCSRSVSPLSSICIWVKTLPTRKTHSLTS